MDAKTHQKITIRHLGRNPLPTAAPIAAEEIRAAREHRA
jgi:putative transcriptional regulator